MDRRQIVLLFPVFFLAARVRAHSVDELHVYPGVLRPVPGQAGVAIAMFEIHAGKEPDALLGARSPAAKTIAIIGRDGTPTQRLAIGAGEDLVMTARGPHLRLSGITGQLTPGREFPLRLTFARQGELGGSVTVPKA